jgi:hypothetical protein
LGNSARWERIPQRVDPTRVLRVVERDGAHGVFGKVFAMQKSQGKFLKKH